MLCLKNYKINGVDKLPDQNKDIINFSLENFYWTANLLDCDSNWTKDCPTRVVDKLRMGASWYLPPKSRSARLISACPIVQAMVGQPGFLYLIGIGPHSSSLMLVAKNIFLDTLVFLFLVHVSLRNLHRMGLVRWHQEVAHLSLLSWRSQLSYPCVNFACCFSAY